MGYAYDESPFVPLRTTTSGNSRPTEAMQDAEIAKLREERAIHLASIAEHSKQLAAARAALDGERELHDETQRALSLGIEFAFDASDGRPGIDTACEVIAKYDALRAAEAITVPPNRTGTREESQAIADWHHDEINRRAAEAKSTTYPFPVESSPSVPPGTIVAMRDGKVVGAITDVAAEAKQLPCPDCKGSGVRVKYHGGSLTDPNVIGLAMESSPCWCQAAEAKGEPK